MRRRKRLIINVTGKNGKYYISTDTKNNLRKIFSSKVGLRIVGLQGNLLHWIVMKAWQRQNVVYRAKRARKIFSIELDVIMYYYTCTFVCVLTYLKKTTRFVLRVLLKSATLMSCKIVDYYQIERKMFSSSNEKSKTLWCIHITIHVLVDRSIDMK